MTSLLRRRAKRQRALREARYAVYGAWRSITWPICHPYYFLYARYLDVFFELYYHVDEEKALRWARLWPRYVPHLAELLIERRGDYRLGRPL